MNKQKILFFFILIIIPFLISGYELIIKDCNGDNLNPLEDLKASQIKRALDNAISNAKSCIPKSCYDKIMKKLKNKLLLIYIDCSIAPGACASTDQYWNSNFLWSINISYQNNFKTKSCGCLEGIILHELLHWGAELPPSEERKAYGCQLKCYPECTRLPKQYKNVTAKDCCCP